MAIKCSLLYSVFSIPTQKPLSASPAVCELVRSIFRPWKCWINTHKYIWRLQRGIQSTQLSALWFVGWKDWKEKLFFRLHREVKTVYCSRSDKQCESKHTGYWKSMTRSGTVSDAHTNCSHWHTFWAFRACQCCFCDLITYIVYHNTNDLAMWHDIVTFS